MFTKLIAFVVYALSLCGISPQRFAALCHRIGRKDFRLRRVSLPLFLRLLFLKTGFVLQPLYGGSGINGARVILYVDISDSAGSQWTRVGGQMGLDFADTTEEIDVSDKLSGRLGERVPGRATASVSLELNFQTNDPAQDYIKAAYRARETVMVQRFYRDTADVLTGEAIEETSGVIVDLSESHPDQDKSTVSLEISLNNDWVPST